MAAEKPDIALTTDGMFRWLIRKDLDRVLEIEQAGFDVPWTEAEFLHTLRQKNCIGSVWETHAGYVVGYTIYELNGGRLELLNLAVDPDYRRTNVGGQMVEKLKTKLHQQRQRELATYVRETNVEAQLFFQSLGFVATGVVNDFYDHCSDAAYRMIFKAEWLEIPA